MSTSCGAYGGILSRHMRAFKGFIAWVVWLVVHLIRIIGFRNKLMVLVNWAWDYFFYERGARLITRGAPPPGA